MVLDDWKRQKQVKRLVEEVKESMLATLKETLKNHYDLERDDDPAFILL
jgi:hypothetical protein